MSDVKSDAAVSRAATEEAEPDRVRPVLYGLSLVATLVVAAISHGSSWVGESTVWQASGPLLVPYVLGWFVILAISAAVYVTPAAHRRTPAAVGFAAIMFQALLAVAIVQRGLAEYLFPGLHGGIVWCLVALGLAAGGLGIAKVQ